MHIDAEVLGVKGRKVFTRAVGRLDGPDGQIAISAAALFVQVPLQHFIDHGTAEHIQRAIEDRANGGPAWRPAGEIDAVESVSHDLLPLLQKKKDIALARGTYANQYSMRPNWLHPPFNNEKMRQALGYMIDQKEYLTAAVGESDYWRLCKAYYGCGTPLASDVGTQGMLDGNLARARELVKESGYDGKPIVMLHQTDLQSSNQLPAVGKQLLEKAGFKVDVVSSDWQTVVSRRARKEAPDKGGWNVFYTTTTNVDSDNPAANSFSSGGCDKAWFGWPCDPEMEKLRAAFARETDPAKQKELALAASDRIMNQAQYVVLGQYLAFGAYRKDRVDGWLPSPAAVWWNISKK